jgi:hypothetical protein
MIAEAYKEKDQFSCEPRPSVYFIQPDAKCTLELQTGKIQDLENASKHYLLAWSCRIAIPFPRIRAAARGLKLLATQGKFGKAADLVRNVIDMLPLVNNRSQSRIKLYSTSREVSCWSHVRDRHG